ncbi:TPA: hypothetical protein H1009_00380 [archaeon]|nr:hypothetical protein [Candidatus Naiadarchaeales archaeon SRR2090153.bin461]
MVKAPICNVCLTSDMLCTGCESKIKGGEITEGDVSFGRALVQLSEVHPVLDHVEFKKTIERSGMFLVVVPRGTLKNLIGKNGIFIKELSKMLKAVRLKVVEETNNPREMIERIVYPANLIGVNIAYNGKKQSYKVRIPRSEQIRIPNKKAYESLFEKLLGVDSEIIFE